MKNVLKDHFDSIYIINLPHRVDRKREIRAQFSNIGLDVDEDYIRMFPAIRPSDAGGFTTVGARGCFLSHLSVLVRARDRAVRSLLIVEDDCNFVRTFTSRITTTLSALPEGSWGFFYGGALNTIGSDKVRDHWLEPAQAVMGTHFLAIDGSLLAGLVDYFEAMLMRRPGDPNGGPMHVDGAYSWFRAAHPELTTYIASPELVYQRSSPTDVHERKWYESAIVLNGGLQVYRQTKNQLFELVR